VPYANLTNPQTLNLYAMVGDDPESFADLDGHGPPGSNNVTDGLAALDAVLDCAQGGSDCGALLELVGMDDYGAGTAPPITYASVNPPPPGSTTPPPPPTAQNQSTAPVPNTQSQQIPGTPFTITNFTGALFTNGEYGVAIGATANCSGCSGWVQTITKTGAGDTWGREFVDNGNTATNHYYTNPIYGGGNYFSDMPTAPNGGSFKGIVWAGSADVQNKTFTTQAAFAYRFSVSKSGKLSGMAPRPATNTERAHSLATIRADYPRWTIN
jgi:hypothetical protein